MFFDCSSLASNTNERKVKFVAVETWSPFIHVLRPQGWPKRPIKSWKFESVVPSEHGVDEIYSVSLRYRKITPLFVWTVSNHRIVCPCFYFCFVLKQQNLSTSRLCKIDKKLADENIRDITNSRAWKLAKQPNHRPSHSTQGGQKTGN